MANVGGVVDERVIDLQVRRWKKLEEFLLQELMAYSRDGVSESAISDAMRLFWGEEGISSPEFDDEPSFARFFDWFVFDYRRNRRCRRLIERFRDDCAGSLSEECREMLDQWLQSRLGFYEVISVNPGEGLTIRDIFTGQRFQICERTASRAVHRYDLLFTRPLKVFGTYGVSVAGLVIPRTWKTSLEGAIRCELARYRKRNPGAGWDQFFREKAYKINRLIVRMLLDRSRPRLRTSSGEALLPSRAWFEVADADADAVSAVLHDHEHFKPQLIERDKDGRLIKAGWTWFGPMTDDMAPVTGSLVLGEVRLQRGFLSLQCLSHERLEMGKQLLFELLGRSVRHRLDDFKNPPAVGAYDGLNTRSQASGGALSPEVADAVQRFLNNYYRRWVDEPVPALDGSSPRDACQTTEGRNQVIELLKLLENMEEKKRRSGEPYVKVSVIRQELGLPEEE